MHREKSLGEAAGSRWNVARRYARHDDNKKRRLKERTANYSAMSENRYNGTAWHAEQDLLRRRAHEEKEIIEKELDIKWNTHIKLDRHALEQDLRLRVLTDEAAKGKAELDLRYENLKAGVTPLRAAGLEGPETAAMTDLLHRATDTTEQLAIVALANQAAKNIQQKNFGEALSVQLADNGSNRAEFMRSQERLQAAAGIDPDGRVRAQAHAEAALQKSEREALDNSVVLLNTQAIRKGKTLKEYAVTVINQEIEHAGSNERPVVEAALEAAAKDGQISVLRKARMSDNIDQTTLTKLFARNADTMKAKGGFDLQDNPGLAGATPVEMNQSIASTIGEISANNIAGVKFGFWKDISEQINTIMTDAQGNPNAMGGLLKTYGNITEALRNPQIRATLGDRLQETIAIHTQLHQQFGDPNMAVTYEELIPRNPNQP